jgi:O-antigen ligase
MTTTTATLDREGAGRHIWMFAAVALGAFGIVSGGALALGETAAFYLSLSVIVGIAVLLDFRLGALLLIVTLPFSNTSYFPHNLFGIGGLNPTNLLFAATLLSYVLRHKIGALLPPSLVWLFIVPILLAGVLGMRHVDDIPLAFEEVLATPINGPLDYFRDFVVRPLLLPLMAMLLAAAVARSAKPERFLIPIVLSVWLIALLEIGFIAASGVSLAQLASPTARSFFSEIGLHANDFGRFFAGSGALLLFVWWEAKNPTLKLALFVTLCVTGIALLLTFSRSGYLAFLVASGLFMLWKFNVRSVSLALFGVVLIAVIAPGYVWRRATFGFDADANTVSADRLEGIWKPLWPELWNSPVWGNGIDALMWSAPLKAGQIPLVSHPHNAYLQTFYDTGFIGLGLLLAFYWYVWKGFRSLGSNPYITPELRGFFQGGAAALICLLVTGFSGGSLRPEVNFACLWIAIGMMYGMLARRPAA